MEHTERINLGEIKERFLTDASRKYEENIESQINEAFRQKHLKGEIFYVKFIRHLNWKVLRAMKRSTTIACQLTLMLAVSWFVVILRRSLTWFAIKLLLIASLL